MMGAQCIAAVVATTAVARVRKHDVFVLVVANPIGATLCFREIPDLAAKPAFWFDGVPF